MIVQTEIDEVYFQQFAYDATTPGIATASTEALFKRQNTEHAAFIGAINRATGLYPIIGETQTVPESTPSVKNKYTILIKDFADSIPLSKNLFDDNINLVLRWVSSLFGKTPRYA